VQPALQPLELVGRGPGLALHPRAHRPQIPLQLEGPPAGAIERADGAKRAGDQEADQAQLYDDGAAPLASHARAPSFPSVRAP
jgi:hypothetical protein